MVNMNMVIANNINKCLEKQKKKQVELAEYLNVSRQTVSKMMNGARTITAGELRKISEFCGSTMEDLTSVPTNYEEADIFHVFMGQVKTEEARQSIRDIDTLIELILFHDQVKENGAAMREEWTEF
ncbi:MAG: helix-turn-helix domain-containing protein [Eubacteriales bacterium]|nr:helix-turn-helix domain-containing protein [Eubacteriales bacterium]